MTAVNAAVGNLLAIERIQTILQSNFATSLADAEIALTGLPLDAPAAENYHIVNEEPSAKRRTQTEKTALYLWQDNRTREVRRTTLSPSSQSVDRLLYISAMVAFRQRNLDDLTHLSQTMDLRTVMAQRAHRYASALKDVGFSKAFCGGAGIIFVRIDNDSPAENSEIDQETMRGFATVTFELLQWTTETI